MLNSKRKIRSSVTLLIIALLVFTLGASSPADAVRVKYKHKQKTAEERFTPWSLQFALDEQVDDNDEDYSGIRFSLSHFFSSTQALRFSMGVGDRNSIYDESKFYRRGDALYLFEEYTEFDVTSVNFSIQGMFYSSPRKEPRFYFGLGPRLGVSEANPVVFVSYYDDDWMEAVDYSDGSQVSFGLEGTLGFEMFLGPNLSMIAELETTFQKEWYILEFDYYDRFGHIVTDTEAFGDDFHFDATRFKLGMSLYF